MPFTTLNWASLTPSRVTLFSPAALAFTVFMLEFIASTLALAPPIPRVSISLALLKSSVAPLELKFTFKISTPLISTCCPWLPLIPFILTVSLPAPPLIGMIAPVAPVTLKVSS